MADATSYKKPPVDNDTYSDHVDSEAASEVYDENGSLLSGKTGSSLGYGVPDSRKIGVTGAVFLILNKMIGTGIFSTPSSIFASTGSVGISILLWAVGELSGS